MKGKDSPKESFSITDEEFKKLFVKLRYLEQKFYKVFLDNDIDDRVRTIKLFEMVDSFRDRKERYVATMFLLYIMRTLGRQNGYQEGWNDALSEESGGGADEDREGNDGEDDPGYSSGSNGNGQPN